MSLGTCTYGFFGLLAALFAMVWSAPAEACSLPQPGIHEREIIPKDGSKEVPLNAQIQLHYSFAGNSERLKVNDGHFKAVVLRAKGSTQDIQVTWETDENAQVMGARRTDILTPREPLAPHTTYELLAKIHKVPCGRPGGQECVAKELAVISSFTTHGSSDHKAPQFSGVRYTPPAKPSISQCDADSCCGPYRYATFSLQWDAAKDEGPFPVRYNLYYKHFSYPIALRVKSIYGALQCSGNRVLGADAYYGSPGKYAVRAVDIAGNEDPNTVWVDIADLCKGETTDPPKNPNPPANPPTNPGTPPVKSEDPPKIGCSQSHSPGGIPFAGLLMGLGFLALRNTRSRP